MTLVLVASAEDDATIEAIQDTLGPDVSVCALPPSSDPDRRRFLKDAEVLLVFPWHIEPGELAHLRRVRLVQSVWAGVDRIPVATLWDQSPDLVVASGAGANADAVAEHAMALLLDAHRRVTWRDREMRRDRWRQWVAGRQLSGSTVAVVGWGEVGRRVGAMLRGFDVRILAVTRDGRAPTMADRGGAPGPAPFDAVEDLDGLRARLPSVRSVVLTVPLTRHTKGLVDASFLRRMPPDGVLVNVARARLVDGAALYDHLVHCPEFQVGLDVWWRYPKDERMRPQPWPFERLPNVVMTPHSAFLVPGARAAAVASAVGNVAAFLAGGPVENAVRRDDYVE